MDVNQTYCGDHFTVYTNIERLRHTPETNIMFMSITYISMISKRKKKPIKSNEKREETVEKEEKKESSLLLTIQLPESVEKYCRYYSKLV